MSFIKSENLNWRLGQFAFLIAAACVTRIPASAATFTPSTFATGAAVNSTRADSVTYGGGSLWVEYSNGASSSNYTGTSTIVQYSTSGAVQSRYAIGGNVDGLKYNPNTNQVWALQNQDGNSQLSVITPGTPGFTTTMYPAPVSTTRGFDDVAFLGNSVYLSQTNPSSTSDAVVVRLNSSTPTTPMSFSTVVTGAGIVATDPDSLKATPNGGLMLTGEGDGTLTFITNPGLASQSATSLKLSAAPGATIGAPDDALYATATSGTFYLTDTTANMVYAIAATGLTPGSLFVNVGNAFGSVDTNTGVVTSLFNGTGLHGLEFVPTASNVPEPASLGISLLGLGLGALAIARKRFAK